MSDAAAPRPEPVRRKRRGRTAVVVGALLLGLPVAEVAARVWLWSEGTPYDAQQAARSLRTLLLPTETYAPGAGAQLPSGTQRPILNPYYASEERPDFGGVFAHFRSATRPDDYTILLTGGSVAAFFALTEGEALARDLQGDPRLAGRRVVVLQGAHASHKQPQQLNRVALHLSLGHRPDLVIDLNGFNEMAFGVENGRKGCHPAWPTSPSWGSAVAGVSSPSPERMDLIADLWGLRNESYDLVRTVLKHGLQRSCAIGSLAQARLRSLGVRRNDLQQRLALLDNASGDERTRRQVGGPDFDGEPGALLEISERVWTESSRSMRALLECRGLAYLHVLQPALFDAESKTPSDEERRIQNPNSAWMVGARVGLPRLRRAGETLAAEGEHFVDASRMFAGSTETYFVDAIHFTPKGNAMLRALIVERIRAEILPR
jgi:hypothetical protein